MAVKISIAMATHNGGRFLREQLESLYMQTRKPDEVVVSDDGSTDETMDILAEFGIKGERLEVRGERLEARERVNRNFFNALRQTTGEYICICDQDDIWFKEKIETLAKQMDKMNPHQPNCVSSLRNDMDAEGRMYDTPTEQTQTSGWQATLLTYGRNQGCTMMINRALLNVVLEKLQAYPDLMMQMYYDELIAYSAVVVGEKVNLPIALMNYRHHEGNAVDPMREAYTFREKVEHLPTLYGLMVDERMEPLCAIRKAFEKEIKDKELRKFLDEIAGIMDTPTTCGKWKKAIRVSCLSVGQRLSVACKSAMSIVMKRWCGFPTLRRDLNNPARVLMVSHYLRDNGTEAYIMHVVRALSKSGVKFDFMLFSDDDSVNRREAERLGCRVYCLPSRRDGWAYYKQLRIWFRNHARDYDWVHWCGGNLSSIAPIRMAYRYGLRVIVHAHNSNSTGWHNQVLHTLHRCAASRKASVRLACSEGAGKYFFGQRSYQVVHNSIDLTQYAFNPTIRQAIREEHTIAEGECVIGMVGRLEEVKNPWFALQILAQMPKAKLMMIGDGSLRSRLEEQAKVLGIGNRVIWKGHVSNVGEYMQAMDVLVMPSLFEGLPFVLVEAQTAGLPCIVSEHVAAEARMTEAVEVVELKVEQWVEAIERQIKEERKDGSKEIARKGFGMETLRETMEKIYSNI